MKKIYKIILLFLVIFIFILVVGPNLFLKRVITSSLENSLNKRVTIGSIWLNPFTGTLFSHNTTVWKNEKDPLLSLKSIKINIDPLKLFGKKLSISEVRLIEPTFSLINLDESSDIKKEPSTKIQNSSSTTSSKKFIEEIEINNIAIENLSFIRSQGILKSMNTITLKIPDFTYENDELNLSANLNILGSGIIDIKIKANTKTNLLDTSLISEGFDFNNTFSSNKKNVINLSGNLKGDLFLHGNYQEKMFEIKGNLIGSNILAEDEQKNQILNSKHMSMDLKSLTFPEISLNLKKLEIEDTQSNFSIFSGEKTPPLSEEKKKTTELSKDEKNLLIKDIKIDEVAIKRSSLSYKDLTFTDIDLNLKDLKNVPQNKSLAVVSFTLNDTINFSSESSVEVLDYSTKFNFLKSINLSGNLLLNTPSLELPDSIKKDFPYEAKIKKVNLKSDYSYSYPNLTLNSDIFTENLKLTGKEGQLNDILLKSLYGKVSSTYNLEDKSYFLSGPLDLKTLNIKDKKNQNFFNGDISIIVSNLSKKKIVLNSVKLNNFLLDLNSKIFPEKVENPIIDETRSEGSNLTSKEEKTEILIDDLQLREGKILTKDLSFENIYLDGKNISNKKINSDFVLDTLINNSAFLKADINIKLDDIDILSDLKAKGNFSVSNLDLKTVAPYIKSIPYELNGVVNYSSSLDYSKDFINSKGDFSASNLDIKKPDSIEISMENIRSKINLNLKNKEITFSNSSFSFSNLNGKIKNNTKFKIPKGDIVIREYSPTSINFDSVSLISPLTELNETPKQSSKSDKPSTVSDEQKKENTLPIILAKNIKIEDGEVIYRGLEKTSTYNNIGVSAKNFTTTKNKKFPIDAYFSIKGIEKIQLEGNLTLKEDWNFSPKTLTFNGALNVTNLNISDFNTNLRKSLPNEFDGGVLSSKGKVDLKSGLLNSEHDITISKIDLGKSTGNSWEIPLGSIINILTDKYGNINITLPVTGDLSNPKLGITGIVTSSLMSGLMKAAKSPQTIISKILTLENKEIKTIYFKYLSSELSKVEKDKLNEIVNILRDNPTSKVTFTLYTNDNIEKSLISTKSITGILSGQMVDSNIALENLMEDRKKYFLNFFSGRISSDRVEVKISSDSEALPQAKIEFKE